MREFIENIYWRTRNTFFLHFEVIEKNLVFFSEIHQIIFFISNVRDRRFITFFQTYNNFFHSKRFYNASKKFNKNIEYVCAIVDFVLLLCTKIFF